MPEDSTPKSRYDLGDKHPSEKNKVEAAPFSDPRTIITFLVGSGEPKKFYIPKEVVCHHSKVLKEALANPNTRECQTQTYRLKGTTIRAFRLFMQWMNTQKLVLLQTSSNHQSRDRQEDEEAMEDMSLVELWVLAEKFGMPHLQNAIIDNIYKISEVTGEVPTWTFDYIYENTIAGSSLRKFVLGLCVEEGDDSLLIHRKDDFPKEMLVELAHGLVLERGAASKKKLVITDFYVRT